MKKGQRFILIAAVGLLLGVAAAGARATRADVAREAALAIAHALHVVPLDKPEHVTVTAATQTASCRGSTGPRSTLAEARHFVALPVMLATAWWIRWRLRDDVLELDGALIYQERVTAAVQRLNLLDP